MTDSKHDPLEKPDLTKSTIASSIETLGRIGLQAIPYGGAAAELISIFIAPPVQRRMIEFLEEVATRIRQLERTRKDFSLDSLRENPEFQSVFVRACESARRSHHNEKLQALRNAILRTAIRESPADGLAEQFVQMVDELGPWHLRVLAALGDPSSNPKAHALNARMEGLPWTTIATFFPELGEKQDFAKQIARDLTARSLVYTEIFNRGAPRIGPAIWITTTGQGFLRFISSPSGLDDQP